MTLSAFWAFATSRAAGALILAAAVAGAYLAVRALKQAAIDERDERRAALGTEDA